MGEGATYTPKTNRYDCMKYRRCGKSGLLLPMLSLGLWHNFGDITPVDTQQRLLRTAFDNGITYFDLANNYGPPYGAAERNFGYHMDRDWHTHRDELIIATKAGYDMWPGPYGNNGSKKYLIASLDQSLKRMHLEYVDIFYHHRPDPDTPLEETMDALTQIVKSGKALYVGISNYYTPSQIETAAALLQGNGVELLVNQVRYSMFSRDAENGALDSMKRLGIGGVAFAPLHSGMLTDKYIHGLPADSRAMRDPRYLKPCDITSEKLDKIRQLNELAKKREQSLAQMALAWVLRSEAISSALIGASRTEQIFENMQALDSPAFENADNQIIEEILMKGGL